MNNETNVQAKKQMVQDIMRRCLYEKNKFTKNKNNNNNKNWVQGDCIYAITRGVMYGNVKTVMTAFPQPIKDDKSIGIHLYTIKRELEKMNKNKNSDKFEEAFKMVWEKMKSRQRKEFLMKQKLTVLKDIRDNNFFPKHTAPVNRNSKRLDLVQRMMRTKVKDKGDEMMRKVFLIKGKRKRNEKELLNAYTSRYPLGFGNRQDELRQKMNSIFLQHPNGSYVHNINGLYAAYLANEGIRSGR